MDSTYTNTTTRDADSWEGKEASEAPLAEVRTSIPESLDEGRDEMNLIEFPLSSISNRILDGRKTVVLSDKVWDKTRREYLPRELAISGSDRYGLPTARDEDVLLACVQLAARSDFRSRQVHFTRYQLLQLLRWPDESKYYQRVAVSLRRWKGVTIYSQRAYYDHAHKSWVNRDFGILDNLYLYERELSHAGTQSNSSWLVWNEVLFNSFQAGYLKKLDWHLYCELRDPVAKRLYRLLDKRFYRSDEVVFDLHELAFRKIRLSNGCNTAQIKRALMAGIHELETKWELRGLSPERRFVKRERGHWEVVFQRKRRRSTAKSEAITRSALIDLELELIRRELGPAMASDLVESYPRDIVEKMIALFDWYGEQGKQKGPGFLVHSIRKSDEYRMPRGFVFPRTQRPPIRKLRARNGSTPKTPNEAEVHLTPEEILEKKSFTTFWNALSVTAKEEFEDHAVASADAVKRDGYRRLRVDGGPGFEHYRQIILRDHFRQSKAVTAAKSSESVARCVTTTRIRSSVSHADSKETR